MINVTNYKQKCSSSARTLYLILTDTGNRHVDPKSVMCDVIKLRLERKDERISGKGKPQEEMDLHLTLLCVDCPSRVINQFLTFSG